MYLKQAVGTLATHGLIWAFRAFAKLGYVTKPKKAVFILPILVYFLYICIFIAKTNL